MKTRLRTILILLVLLGLLGVGGAYAAYKGYKYVRQVRLVKQAKAHLEKAEDRKALLCLQRALRYNNRDVEAARLMAQLLEAGRSPAALVWRSRVVELSPDTRDDRMALVQTALLFRDYSSATNALEGMDEEGRKTAAYHNLAGMAFAAANQVALAEQHFAEAARLEPANAAPRLNLAVIHLQNTNAQVQTAARASLREISSTSTNASLRSQALRELAGDALRHKDPKTALEVTQKLLQETNTVFRDKLLRLEVLQESKSPDFRPTLTAFQNEAAADPAKAYDLAMWQMANLSPADSLGWLLRLPEATRTNASVILATVQCQDVLKDWKGLETLIRDQTWGDLEFLRHAYLARAQRGQDLAAASKAEWELALKNSNNQLGALRQLLGLCAQWKWLSEAEEVLWNIVNRYPGEKWAVQVLTQALYAGGRTRPLMMLFNQELKRSPDNLSLKNNLALTALLLEARELKPHELAREVFTKSPTNAAFASTYAFSLFLQDKNDEALKIMQTLSPRDLENPSVAGYYGLMLKAAGDKKQSQVLPRLGFQGPHASRRTQTLRASPGRRLTPSSLNPPSFPLFVLPPLRLPRSNPPVPHPAFALSPLLPAINPSSVPCRCSSHLPTFLPALSFLPAVSPLALFPPSFCVREMSRS